MAASTTKKKKTTNSNDAAVDESRSNQPPEAPITINTLVTPKSLALALSAPRAPPYGSLHRNILLGGRRQLPPDSPWARHYRITDDRHERDTKTKKNDTEEAHSWEPHDTLRQRLRQRCKAHFDAPHNESRGFHPHLPAGPEWGDQVTRYLGLVLPLEWQHYCRDSGGFRSICDTLVTATVPSAAVGAPRAAYRFLKSTWNLQQLQYGPHARHYIHLYVPPPNVTTRQHKGTTQQQPQPPRRLILFVHGGAWGSGLPWMYRLVGANPQFWQQNWAVAVVGFRPYPDGCIAEQLDDVAAAARYLRNLYPHTPTTLMGHSSGAHVALLLLVDRVIEQLEAKYQRETATLSSSWKGSSSSSTTNSLDRNIVNALGNVDSFVGLSGPYDISHHFDYEAARGVEELSPLKPVNGYTRQNFHINSPARRLRTALAHVHSARTSTQNTAATTNDTVSTAAMDDVMPPLLLMHGIVDATVPFTSTAEAARILKSCGVTHCDEIYLAETGHQDVVIQFMMGGPALDETLDWIRRIDEQSSKPSSSSELHNNSGTPLVARSKL